jgi:hypothetical protein
VRVTAIESDSAVYWDPYDSELLQDPYPALARLREEAPLYYNAAHDFYAVSRYADVERGLPDWQTFSSARGSILELVKSGIEIPPGTLTPTGGCCRASSPRAGLPRWSRGYASSAPARSTRSSARTGST